MYLSKHSNGIYYVYFIDTFSGKRKSVSTKTRKKAEALQFLSEIKARQKPSPSNLTLKKVIADHLRWSEAVHTINTYKTYRTTFNAAEEYFGDAFIADLNTPVVEDFLNIRIRKVSAYQARRDYIHLHCLFNRLMQRGILEENLLGRIRKPKIPENQPSFFTKSEYDLLIKNCKDKDLNDIIIFAVNTGLRQMEILTLIWNSINFDENI